MAENIDIEAKLCSYVEGDLDPASRAEIERYLQANPQYRAVLDELVRTRADVRSLPRVRAPMDVQEVIAGQLERSALLGNSDLLRTVGRARGFPYARAWAAIVFLTVALAAVIYSVLPAHKPQMTELANLTTRPIDDEINSVAPGTAPSVETTNPAMNPTVMAMAATPATEMAGAVADAAISSTAPTVAALPATMPGPQPQLAQAIVVPAANLLATESQLHDYLQSHNFSYATSVTNVADGTTVAGIAPAGVVPHAAMSAGGAKANQPIGAPEVRMITVHQLNSSQLQQTRMAIESLGRNSTLDGTASAERMRNFASGPTTAPQFSNGNVLSTTLPLSDETDLTPGQQIQVSAEDTGLGGVAGGVSAMDDLMTIDPDGNIALPLVGKVRAAGLTPSALSRSIALQYEIARSPTRATWTIHPAPKLTIDALQATTNESATTQRTAAIAATQPAMAITVSTTMPTASTEFQAKQIAPSATQPVIDRQGMTQMRIQSGEGGASLMNSPEDTRVSAAGRMSPPTTLPTGVAGTMKVMSATEPDEPRSDLTIVLIQTTPPATMPSAPAPPPPMPTTVPTLPTTAP